SGAASVEIPSPRSAPCVPAFFDRLAIVCAGRESGDVGAFFAGGGRGMTDSASHATQEQVARPIARPAGLVRPGESMEMLEGRASPCRGCGVRCTEASPE